MDLASYKRAAEERTSTGNSQYIRFETHGEKKILRFMHDTVQDIKVKYKKWDDVDKKYLYSNIQPSKEWRAVAFMNCIEYLPGGGDPKRVIWQFSAHVTVNQIVPYITRRPRIKDGVWEVTVNNPKDMNISVIMFPVEGADTVSYPIIAGTEEGFTQPTAPAPRPAATAPRRDYFAADVENSDLPF